MAEERDGTADREQLRPETTVAVAALFIAVAGLAREIGGFAAAIAAAAIGAAVALLLFVPLLRMHRRPSPLAAGRRLAPALAGALVLTSAAFSGLFVWDAVRLTDDAATRDAIRTAILQSYSAEISWYKNPSADRAAQLERWFVPTARGGERLRIIEAEIDRLRRCRRKIGASAATTTFVTSITVYGDTAEAHTVQSLYQPVYDFHNGRWVVHPVAPADLSFSVPDQLYLLRRVDGRWKVQSAPQPQNLGAC